MNTSKNTVKVYDKIANKYSKTFDDDLSDNFYLDKVLTYLPKGAKVLDLGCGTGRLTNYIYKKGFDVKGLDLSNNMLQIAKSNYPKIKFIKKDIRKLNYKKKFSAVFCLYSLFHINKSEVIKIIPKLNTLINNDGFLYLILQEGKGEILFDEPLLPGNNLYLNLYTLEEMTNILTENNFEIVFVDRKSPKLNGELPYNKLMILAKKIK